MIPSPSPSMKIQIMGRKVCLRCKDKTLLGHCQQTQENKKFVDITQQCFDLLPQVNFPANNLNFHWRRKWLDWIQAIFLNLLYFIPKYIIYCNRDKLKVISYIWPLSQHIIQEVSCATYRCGHQSFLTSALGFSVNHQMMTKNAERKKFAGKNMPLLLSNYRNKCLCLWM